MHAIDGGQGIKTGCHTQHVFVSCTTLDASGLICPEPIMLLHQAIKRVATGHWILLISTDPAATRDVGHFCQFLHHRLLQQHQWQQNQKTYYAYLVEKGTKQISDIRPSLSGHQEKTIQQLP